MPTSCPHSLQPTLYITHVARAANDEVVALGYVDRDGHTVWRVPADELVAMYHCGVRFVAGYGGRVSEIYVEPAYLASNDARICSRLDGAAFKLLKVLPELPA